MASFEEFVRQAANSSFVMITQTLQPVWLAQPTLGTRYQAVSEQGIVSDLSMEFGTVDLREDYNSRWLATIKPYAAQFQELGILVAVSRATDFLTGNRLEQALAEVENLEPYVTQRTFADSDPS